MTLIFKHARARNETRLPCEFGANPFSGSRDVSYANKQNRRLTAPKQNLPQFTACGNKLLELRSRGWDTCPPGRESPLRQAMVAVSVAVPLSSACIHWTKPGVDAATRGCCRARRALFCGRQSVHCERSLVAAISSAGSRRLPR